MVVFLLLAIVFALLAYGALSKLWGYQDDPEWVYIVYGIVETFLAAVCLTAAVRSRRRG